MGRRNAVDMMPASAALSFPPRLAARYRAVKWLGAGAMGEVFEAHDTVIERQVAVKLVRWFAAGPNSASLRARFKREAAAAGRLAHPHIAGVFDYGEDDESAWIVMELVRGGTLGQRLDQEPRPTVAEAATLVGQMLSALEFAHGQGVVHRDIKPGNVMLAPNGAKLIDFGIARIENTAATSLTMNGMVMGTVSYMAPEQFTDDAVDARADLWAVGVVLYELLTDVRPFAGDFSVAMNKILHVAPPRPRHVAADLPPGFDALLAKALEKRPEARFQSAATFAAALRDCLVPPKQLDQPAGSTRAPGNTWRWMVAAGAGLVLGGLALWQWPAQAPSIAPSVPLASTTRVPAEPPVTMAPVPPTAVPGTAPPLARMVPVAPAATPPAAPAVVVPSPEPPATPVAIPRPPAAPVQPLSREQVAAAQGLLNELGFDAGPADGMVGVRSRVAMERFAIVALRTDQVEFDTASFARLGELHNDFVRLTERASVSPRGVPATSAVGGRVRYERGWSAETATPADTQEATYWYGLAARDRDTAAMVQLGLLLVRRQGQGDDPIGASLLWRLAAARGDTTAAYNLGALLEGGHGVVVARNLAWSVYYYGMAAEAGHGPAGDAVKRLRTR